MEKPKGPRHACRILDSLADDLGDPIVSILRAKGYDDSIPEIENVLTSVFTGEKMDAVRSYIYRPTLSHKIHGS